VHTKEIEDLAMEGFIPSIPGEVEFFIHDKGMHTKEIEDLAMEGFIPSIPEVEFFSNEDICIISKEEVRNWPNE